MSEYAIKRYYFVVCSKCKIGMQLPFYRLDECVSELKSRGWKVTQYNTVWTCSVCVNNVKEQQCTESK